MAQGTAAETQSGSDECDFLDLVIRSSLSTRVAFLPTDRALNRSAQKRPREICWWINPFIRESEKLIATTAASPRVYTIDVSLNGKSNYQ